MTIINKNQVPQYLQKGSFFEALDASDEEGFEVPSDCLKADLTLRSEGDLRTLLRSLRFWGVYEMPIEILINIMKSPTTSSDSLMSDFPEFAEHLSKIFAVKASAPDKTITKAIESIMGVEVVTFLHEQMGFALLVENVNAASRVDDLRSLVYLLIKQPTQAASTEDIILIAAQHGSMKCLKHAREKGWEFPANTVEFATVSADRLKVVKFLREVCGLTYTSKTMACAAVYGGLDLIRYLHETGCPWEEDTTVLMAMHDHLDCLTYAHMQGCPWDIRTCRAAAQGGSLCCLEYAHKEGCPWDETVIADAITYGQVKCLAYACENDCPLLLCVLVRAMWYSWPCLRYVVLYNKPCMIRTCVVMTFTSSLLSMFCNEQVMTWSYNAATSVLVVEILVDLIVSSTPLATLDAYTTEDNRELVRVSLWALHLTITFGGFALALLLEVVDVVMYVYDYLPVLSDRPLILHLFLIFLLRIVSGVLLKIAFKVKA